MATLPPDHSLDFDDPQEESYHEPNDEYTANSEPLGKIDFLAELTGYTRQREVLPESNMESQVDQENDFTTSTHLFGFAGAVSTEELAFLVKTVKQVTDASSLARVLNQALPFHGRLHPGSSGQPLTERSLNFYAYHNKEKRYRTFTIPKRTAGEQREIKAPDHGLLRIQRLLLLCLRAVYGQGDEAAHGFMPGKSVLTNAQPHVGRHFVLNLDLKDFFPSTHIGRVVAVLQLEPFHLPKQVAYLIANLCCDEGALPQGAPTSPLLTNLVCQRLDRQLRQLARRYRCRYTRYADDLTFSSNRLVFKEPFHQELNRILATEGYCQNQKKQRLQTAEMRQEVTGVIVNERPNVSREFVRQIRAMLHNWETQGREVAQEKLRQGYRDSKAHARHRRRTPPIERVLAGKIAYLGMIRGTEDPLYLRLAHQLATLVDEEYKQLSILLELLHKTEELL